MRARELVRIRRGTRRGLVLTALAVAFVVTACGGGSYGGGNTPTPTPGGDGSGASTISIVGDRGNQSFTPNPGSSGQDQMVTWRNTDNTAHRIVLNDGTLDTGDIAPGATSRAVRIPANGTNYHCTIHPGMIGSIRAAGGEPGPPCTGQYC
jgi:plastocyanin